MTTTARPLAAADDALSVLASAVRPEYRPLALAAPRGHPAFNYGPCAVPGCLRVRRQQRELCAMHASRWTRASKSTTLSRAEWTATASPHIGPKACLVEDCQFGRYDRGLCRWHTARYDEESPAQDTALWAKTASRPTGLAAVGCVVPSCGLWRVGRQQMCSIHYRVWQTFRKSPEATIETFVAYIDRPRDATADLSGLPPRLILEMQYAFQSWIDHSPQRTNLYAWNVAIRIVCDADVSSVLDLSIEEWKGRIGDLSGLGTNAAAILRWAWEQVDVLLNGPDGWDREYPRDTWRLARLGLHRFPRRVLSFEPVSQPWLRDLAKRWARHRLATGLSAGTVDWGLAAIWHLSEYLAGRPDEPATPADLTRAHLEGWTASVRARYSSESTRAGRLREVSGFLTDIHRFEWDTSLPASTVLHREDIPKSFNRLPGRAISEYVMKQIEAPENIAKMPNPTYRVVLELMIRCGLRASDAVDLSIDCLFHDDEGNPYLHYLNHKMKREAYLPLDQDLAAHISEQQDAARADFPQGTTKLLPTRFANIDGTRPITPDGFQASFRVWLREITPTDERGTPVHVTPHQFRHTFATRLINKDVPQHIVQQLLDHVTPQMTNHYARLHDKTVRNAWSKARKINAQGEEVALEDDHPLAGAQWARTGLAQAKQTLPNGYCGMPVHSDCEHANPCLTCPLFITTPAFLPQHEAQLRTTLTLIDQAETAGHARVVEKNQQIVGNLTKIIDACNACGSDQVIVGGNLTPSQKSDADAS